MCRGIAAGTVSAEHVACLEAAMPDLDKRGRREGLAGPLVEAAS
jgi:hypothetical protein